MQGTQKTPQTQKTDVRDMINLCTALYVCNILALLMQAHIMTVLFGGVITLCVVAYAYIKRAEMKETIFESHFQWMIRTFWIGGAVYLPIMTIAGSATFMAMADTEKLYEAVYEGEKIPLYLRNLLFEFNGDLFTNIFLATTIPFALWWLWRMARGIVFIRKGEAVPKVNSWV